ncbi:MAG: hypothetical protein K8Q89_10230 [Nitrosarchaeum sp.]|nr:hypothetical protein [Nitrosarchaeum sp.]
MKGFVLLPKIEIRNFTPVTTAGDYVERKKSLKQIILEKIPDINKLKQKTIDKKLFLDVCFYLNAQTGMEGDTQKDLDNLLNAIFDVLPQYFTDEKNQLIDGLGLIEGKSDYMIFETHVTKQFVKTHEEEGFDIEISEIIETKTSSKTRKNFNSWLEDKIFPASNSQETRTAKWIAIWGITASLIFTLGGVVIGVGISFITLGMSLQVDLNAVNNVNQTNPILSNFADRLLETGQKLFTWGPLAIFGGLLIIVVAIIREH